MPAPSPIDTFARIFARFASQLDWWSSLSGNVRGSVWALLSGAVAVIQVSLVKVLGTGLHLTEIILFRQMFVMIVVLPVLVRNFPDVLKTNYLGLHLLRIAAALVAMLMGFTAVINMPLADATTIGFSKSFFVTIFAIMILGETVGYRRWTAVGVGFIGVIIVMQPGAGGSSLDIYAVMALGGAAGASLVMVIIRKISQVDKTLTIMTYQSIGVGVMMIIPAYWFWKMPSLYEFGLLACLGAVSILVQTFNIHAYRAGEASAIASLDYTRLIYALAIGLFLFGDWPDNTVFFGATIIIAAALYTIHREVQISKRRIRNDDKKDVSGSGKQ